MTTAKTSYNEFYIRRFHSLLGVLPLSGFIVFHFFMNSYSTRGAEAFNAIVDNLRGLPFVSLLSYGLLITPFALHILLGMWIIYTGKNNLGRQKHARNWAYLLQRITAMIVFVFIVYHIVSMKYVVLKDDGVNYYALLREKFSNPIIYWWYVVAVAATVYHLANGICTFAMTWGLTVGKKSQQMTAVAMAGAGLLIFGLGMSSLNGFLKDGKVHVKAPAVTSKVESPSPAAP